MTVSKTGNCGQHRKVQLGSPGEVRLSVDCINDVLVADCVGMRYRELFVYRFRDYQLLFRIRAGIEDRVRLGCVSCFRSSRTERKQFSLRLFVSADDPSLQLAYPCNGRAGILILLGPIGEEGGEVGRILSILCLSTGEVRSLTVIGHHHCHTNSEKTAKSFLLCSPGAVEVLCPLETSILLKRKLEPPIFVDVSTPSAHNPAWFSLDPSDYLRRHQGSTTA